MLFDYSMDEDKEARDSEPSFANKNVKLSPFHPLWELKREIREAPWQNEAEQIVATPTHRNRFLPQSLFVKQTNF